MSCKRNHRGKYVLEVNVSQVCRLVSDHHDSVVNVAVMMYDET